MDGVLDFEVNLLHKVRSDCSYPKSGDCPEREWWLKMPKGALLHAHLDATVDVNFMLNRTLEQEALYVRTPAPLTALSPTANVIPEISPFPKSEVKLSAIQSLTDASYDGEWIPVKIARESFSPELGGQEGFEKWFVALTTINLAEAYGTHETVTKVYTSHYETLIRDDGVSVDLGKIPDHV